MVARGSRSRRVGLRRNPGLRARLCSPTPRPRPRSLRPCMHIRWQKTEKQVKFMQEQHDATKEKLNHAIDAQEDLQKEINSLKSKLTEKENLRTCAAAGRCAQHFVIITPRSAKASSGGRSRFCGALQINS